MTPFDIGLLILGGVLTVSALIAVIRVINGPTILDRAVGSDFFVVVLALAFALFSAKWQNTYLFAAMFALTGLAFVGTVTVARFVSRQDTTGPGGRPLKGNRETEHTGRETAHTGMHDAIHPDSGTHMQRDGGLSEAEAVHGAGGDPR